MLSWKDGIFYVRADVDLLVEQGLRYSVNDLGKIWPDGHLVGFCQTKCTCW
jgi:hypothetical protein